MMFRKIFVLLLFLLAWFKPLSSVADAGPPLITDDPKVVGDKNWEINLAFVPVLGHTDKSLEAPLADINYGVGDRIQLKLEFPWEREWKDGNTLKSGFTNSI